VTDLIYIGLTILGFGVLLHVRPCDAA
jgi:hypothetical protein